MSHIRLDHFGCLAPTITVCDIRLKTKNEGNKDDISSVLYCYIAGAQRSYADPCREALNTGISTSLTPLVPSGLSADASFATATFSLDNPGGPKNDEFKCST